MVLKILFRDSIIVYSEFIKETRKASDFFISYINSIYIVKVLGSLNFFFELI
jgi:hypothetical protein